MTDAILTRSGIGSGCFVARPLLSLLISYTISYFLYFLKRFLKAIIYFLQFVKKEDFCPQMK